MRDFSSLIILIADTTVNSQLWLPCGLWQREQNEIDVNFGHRIGTKQINLFKVRVKFIE